MIGRIRRARLEDAAAVAYVHVAGWRETYPGIVPARTLASMDVFSRTRYWAQVLDNKRNRTDIFLAEMPIEYAMPGGSLPRFGDDVNATVRHAGAYLEFAYHAYRDPAWKAHLATGPSWDSVMLGRSVERTPAAPALTSRVFPSAGHAVLRTRGDARLAAVLTFGPYGGFHGHYDKLSFVFFGQGRENFKKVADDAEIGFSENGRFPILVNGHNIF